MAVSHPMPGSVTAEETESVMVSSGRGMFESASDVVGNGIVSKDTMSAMVKLAKEIFSRRQSSSVTAVSCGEARERD